MVLGAGALGVITVFLVELFNRTGRLREDASIGVVFPALFSLGVLMVSRYTSQVDLDLDCVLYGEIAYVPWDLLFFGDASLGPKALWVNGVVFGLNALFVLAFYKELKVTTFDPELAAALGFAPALIHYLLMAAVSLTVVGAFESVGAILVVAMLVVPPAAAYLLTDRLGVLLGLAMGFGVLSAVGGYGLARVLDASIAGAMATVAGLLFLLSFLLSPRYGLIARALRHRRLTLATSENLLLLHLRHGGETVPVQDLRRRFSWGWGTLERVLRRVEAEGWVERVDGGLHLTEGGLRALEEAGQLPLQHRPAA